MAFIESYDQKQQSKTAYTDYSAAQKQAKENVKVYGKKIIRKRLAISPSKPRAAER